MNLRSFFHWDDTTNEFGNRDILLNLYTWIGVYTTQDELQKQIPKAIDIRKLYAVLTHENSKISFYSGASIEQAYALIQKDNILPPSHSMQLKQILKNLEEMPSTFIKKMTDADKNTLTQIIELATEHLK